jgi:hypothetical protein
MAPVMHAPRAPTGDRHIQVERERIVHGSKLLGKMCVLTRGSTTAFVPSRTTKSCAVDSSFATAGRQETAAPRRFVPSIGLSLTRCLWRNIRTPRTARGIRRDLPALPSHAPEVPDSRHLCVRLSASGDEGHYLCRHLRELWLSYPAGPRSVKTQILLEGDLAPISQTSLWPEQSCPPRF